MNGDGLSHKKSTTNMNLKAITALSIVLVFIAGCKKEKDVPAFRAEGYWKGYAYLNHAALVNKSNGVSRIYYGFSGSDTATAFFRVNGTYTVRGGLFNGVYPLGGDDTLFLDSHTTTNSTITGMLWTAASADVVPLSLVKQ